MNEVRSSAARQRLVERLHRQAVSRAAGASEEDALLTTGEIAMLFRVSHRAVRCWADMGRLPYIRTLGGHRRFIASAVWDIFQDSIGERTRTQPPLASEVG